MNTIEKNSVLLFLWQSNNSVVIGRNQNPWKEVNIEYAEENDIQLARRISGGGAVYHDLGNLNFSFISSIENHSLENNFSIILEALKAFNITVSRTNTHDLLFQGKKFSGTALAIKKTAVLHHGTLLMDSNLKMMESLDSGANIFRARGTGSRKSDVVNLVHANGTISIQNLKSILVAEFIKHYNCDNAPLDASVYTSLPPVKELYDKNISWDWLFGKTPQFFAEYWHNEQGVQFEIIDGLVGKSKILPKGEYRNHDGGRKRFTRTNVTRLLKEENIFGEQQTLVG